MALVAAPLFLLSVYPVPSSLPEPPVLATGPALPEVADFATWLARPGVGRATAVVTRADLAAALALRPQQLAAFVVEDAAERAARRYLEGLPFGDSIRAAADRHRLDALLVAAVVEVESRFLPRAVSPRGAVGLMQVLPATAGPYGAADLHDPRANLDVGSRYLAALLDLYDGDLTFALAAYNAGPAVVARYGGVPPFRETRRYVERVLGRYARSREEVEDAVVRARDPFLPSRVMRVAPAAAP
ncbi:MAG TPA: lytic transglycosylase domain-containing protein [Thermoanaerobaculia bacterium]|nr:lytic transglycosylase domain-containing protein [Thermoanaerobaculia bacterium]